MKKKRFITLLIGVAAGLLFVLGKCGKLEFLQNFKKAER